MTDEKQDEPTTGIIDPDTGEAHPNSGPNASPEGSDEGTQARDVVKNGTAGTETGDDADKA
ncbi:hypothetical protein [Patulibacter sp.]|uniref:hypothetical protein n=1 Tax=Patulibacter sp. TaxID=1912859 RepID=UPI002724C519|nr:hypothetical protein [Patulibacter sp.]MDO9408544.1 hypothetical protein [Patulibacter sp.]